MLAAWWCISVPLTLVWFIKLSRLSIFDFPIMQIIQPDGALGATVTTPFGKAVREEIGLGFKWLWWGLIAFAVLAAMLAVAE